MFEWPVQQYFKIVRGDKDLSSILFYILSGIIFGTATFALLNILGSPCRECGVGIPIDYSRFFSFPTSIMFANQPYAQLIKTIEFVTLVLIWIFSAAKAHRFIQRKRLGDAITPIRKQMLGQWILELKGFSVEGGDRQALICRIWFAHTEAQKLRAYYYQSNALDIKGNTSMIAMAVSGESPEPSQIEMSFPIVSKVHANNQASMITYWLSLAHTPHRRDQNITSFSGDWFKCIGLDGKYQNSGSATLTFHQRNREPDDNFN